MVELDGVLRDGVSAADHKVVVRVLGHGLEIVGQDSQLVQRWPLARVRRIEDSPDAALRLTCAEYPQARLVVARPGPLAQLVPARRRRPGLWLGLVAGAAAMVAALVWGLPRLSTAAARMVPVEAERALGLSMAAEIETAKRACAGAEGRAALAALEERLAAPLPPAKRPTRVLVLDDPTVNAIALPGGTVILFRGLLDQAASADEVAGVLAHEMAHVAERHPLAALIRSVGLAALATVITGDLSALAASAGGMALAGSYSRGDEAQADAIAVDLLNAAAIPAAGLAGFFARLSGESGQLPEFLSTHPDLSKRRQAVLARAADGARGPALSPGQWQALRGICGK